MSEADTPRVNAAEFDRDEDCSIEDDMIVTADFARELERENNRLKRQLEEALKTLEEIDGCSQYPNKAGVALDRIKQLSEG